jgi:hypothetical protein
MVNKSNPRRVEDLERMGRLTGVIDDRGKFINVERGEMEKASICLDLASLMIINKSR